MLAFIWNIFPNVVYIEPVEREEHIDKREGEAVFFDSIITISFGYKKK